MSQYYNNFIKEFLPELFSVRRKLHSYPELAFEEYKTTKIIQETVESWGIDFFHFKNMETGGYCEVGEGVIYAFRSDIDGLSILENPDHKIKSKHTGKMHACGHDFHTTIGLGLLKILKFNESKLKGKFRVIFQPGEEAAPGGAEKIIKENIWKDVRGIITTHVDPHVEAGKFILLKGPVQASSTSIFVELKGQGGHTSNPHKTVDLINVAGHYIVQIQNFIKQKTDSQETVVLSFGSINGGDTHNVIPQNITLRGTLRIHNNEILENSMQLMENFTRSFEDLYEVKIKLTFPTSCPATINDEYLTDKFVEFMKGVNKTSEIVFPAKPSMGADDFSFYLTKVPGLYLGIGGAGTGVLHSSDLLLSEDLIEPAIKNISEFILYLFEQ